MADEADSKSVVGNHVRVQVPLPAFKLEYSYGFFQEIISLIVQNGFYLKRFYVYHVYPALQIIFVDFLTLNC